MEKIDIQDKLVRVERTINIYHKNGEDPLEEIDIENLPFEILKQIIIPNVDDPLLYDGYELNEIQFAKISPYLKVKISPNFKIFNYILVTGGIYNW